MPDRLPDSPKALSAEDQADVALMLRFQTERDFDAFQTLFERHKSGFLGYLRSLAGDPATAEDVSQHCWLRLVEIAKAGSYRADSGASFRTFLFTLGRNRFLDEHVRKHEVAKRADGDVYVALDQQQSAGADPGFDPQQLLVSDEQRQRLEAAVSQLPLEQREVIALWATGASIKEMMQVTQAQKDTVLSRKKYALAKLRATLSQPHTPSKEALKASS
ncbi:MAG: sigma-70 family RNA polymerase sigma factor [Pseudomonadales bacterium]